jgi:hypothetical protein
MEGFEGNHVCPAQNEGIRETMNHKLCHVQTPHSSRKWPHDPCAIILLQAYSIGVTGTSCPTGLQDGVHIAYRDKSGLWDSGLAAQSCPIILGRLVLAADSGPRFGPEAGGLGPGTATPQLNHLTPLPFHQHPSLWICQESSPLPLSSMEGT